MLVVRRAVFTEAGSDVPMTLERGQADAVGPNGVPGTVILIASSSVDFSIKDRFGVNFINKEGVTSDRYGLDDMAGDLIAGPCSATASGACTLILLTDE
jgi:hypothetical protein